MYNKILVPLDGSPRAEAIMPHVENLAHCFSAKVILMCVIEPAPLPLAPGDLGIEGYLAEASQRAESEARLYLEARCGEMRAKNIETDIRLIHGPVVQGIVEVAAHDAVDLIMMASHGRTGLSRVFYGSVAAGVLHSVDRPLLLIRAEDARK